MSELAERFDRMHEAKLARLPVVAAVIEDGGCFLVCRRPAEKRHGGLFEFPGGKVDKGETFEEAMRRELAEELGVRLVEVGETLLSLADEGSPFIIHFISARIVGVPQLLEHSEHRWEEPQNLAGLPLAPSDRQFVERYLTGDYA